MELLIQAHLTRESDALSSALQNDFKRMLELAPRLLEELMKVLLNLSFPFWLLTSNLFHTPLLKSIATLMRMLEVSNYIFLLQE